MTGEIRSIGHRQDNAQLMADCAVLGWLPEPVLDMTYGKGRFWTQYIPQHLTGNDLYTDSDYDFDFTELPHDWTNKWSAVVFDAPYKLNGTGGSVTSDEGYGVNDNATVSERMDLIFAGCREAMRVCRSRGFILVKCQDQVVSGQKYWQTLAIRDEMVRVARASKWQIRLVDMLHVRAYREQPPGKRQVHSRGDYSTLLVFQVTKRKSQ